MNNSKSSELAELKDFMSTVWSYWPLFVIVLSTCILFSAIYVKTQLPLFKVTSSILINDMKKGAANARMTDVINPFQNKQLVDNEIEILRSRDILSKVVDDMNLSVGIMVDSSPKDKPVYTTSFTIEHKEIDPLVWEDIDEPNKYYFTIENNTVTLDGNQYGLNEWIPVKETEVRFVPKKDNIRIGDNFYFELYDKESVVEYLIDDLEVESTSKLSTVAKLELEHPVPAMGEAIMERVIKFYYQRATDNKMKIAETTMKFIQQRMDSVSNLIAELNKEIEELRNTEGLIDISEQGKLYLSDVGSFDRQRSGLQTQLAVLNQVEGYINDSSGSVPSSVGVNDPNLNMLLEKLYNSEIEYERLKKTTGANNPLLQSVKRDIDKLKPSIIENVQSQRKNLTAALGNVNYNIGKFSGSLKELPAKERRLVELTRRKEVETNLFSYLQKQREEITLSSVPEFYEANIVEHPNHSTIPTSPKKAIIFLIAIFLGFAACMGYVLKKEFLNNKILYRKDIEKYTQLPVMAEIPFIKIAKTSRIRSKDRLLLDNTFRGLGIQLGLYKNDSRCRTLMITSSIPGEGKSFVSENLARTLSKLGKKVVLIDTDFLKPRISRNHRLENDLGLLDFFNGIEELNQVIYPVYGNENLKIVSAGKYFKNYASVLDAQKFEFFLEHLKKNNDFVIIDSAPLNIITDFGFFAPFVERTLVVVRHNYTPEAVLENMERTDIHKKLVNPSIIFNYVKNSSALQKGANYGYQYFGKNKYGVNA